MKLLHNYIYKNRNQIIYVIPILLVGLISITWFRGNYLIMQGDFRYDLSPISEFVRSFFVWDHTRDFGRTSLEPTNLFPLRFFLFLGTKLGLSLVTLEKSIFYFFLTFSGLSMYYLTSSLLRGRERYLAGLISAFIYMFNTYVLLFKWTGFNKSLFAYAILPMMLGLFINGVNKKKYLKSSISLGFISLIAAPSTNPTYSILIWLVFFSFLFFYALSEWHNKARIAYAFRFVFISLLIYVILNLWMIIPSVISLLYAETYTYLKSPISFTRVTIGSKTTSFLNIFRLLGYWAFHADSRGDPYYPYASIYLTFPFIVISFLIPILAYCGLILKRNRYVIYFGVLSVITLFLIKGTYPPFGGIYRWIYFNLPGYQIFRSQYEKLGVVLALSYSFLLSFTLSNLYFNLRMRSRWKRFSTASLAALFLLFTVYNFPFFTGQLFRSEGKMLKPVRIKIPPYYFDIKNFFEQEKTDFRVVPLPAKLGEKPDMRVYKWGYAGSCFLSSLLSKAVIVGISSEEGEIWSETYKLFTSNSAKTFTLTKILGLLSTKYIILQNDRDWRFYSVETPERIKLLLNHESNIFFTKSFGQLDLYKIADEHFLPHIYACP